MVKPGFDFCDNELPPEYVFSRFHGRRRFELEGKSIHLTKITDGYAGWIDQQARGGLGRNVLWLVMSMNTEVLEAAELRDVDRDSIHILPLSIIPFQSRGLKRTRMIKNATLQSVVEMFEGEGTGSGQVSIDALESAFPDIEPSDVGLLRKLTKLYSYDVFGLRILLRDLGIDVNQHEHLRLSAGKQAQLSAYMQQFTQRLILEIYGSDENIRDYNDVVALFQHPDVNMAREKLKQLSSKLGIELTQVPQFLEDYGDIYLSVAYFRQCMDHVQPIITDFEFSVKEILKHPQLRQDPTMARTCERLLQKILKLNAVVSERFDIFARSTDEMWEDIDATRFQSFKQLVENNHTAIGGLLCTLTVKMSAWAEKFPFSSAGGPVKRAEFILTDMKQGM